MPKQKIIKHKKGKASKKWMRAIRGAVTFKYLSIVLLGCGLIALAVTVKFALRDKQVTFEPLPSVSYRTDAPDPGELLRLINSDRSEAGKKELVVDQKLTRVAEARLKEMIDSQTYSHKSSGGKFFYDLLPSAGYPTSYSCENLDLENTPKAAAFLSSWKSSNGGHKECMLDNRVARAGIASGLFVETDGAITKTKTYLVVAIFAAEPTEPKQ